MNSQKNPKSKETYFNYLFTMLNGIDKDFAPLSRPDVPESHIKLIAFYLPQFHPIPENDEWWGKGFTEWTNVTRAVPQFMGHYQPRLPGELGFYDLRNTEVQQRQVELARQHGIYGFCFHFYWFGGKRLLERPLEQYCSNSEIDFPFCINWANENWSRRWDGKDSDVLISQHHSPEDDIAFIRHVSEYFKDRRYIRINSKPLLTIYRPALLPEPSKTAERWREWCSKNGIGEIYLALTHAFEHLDPRSIGFDAAIEFAPNTFPLSDIGHKVDIVNPEFQGHIFDYHNAIEIAKHYRKPDYKKFRGVCPSWDNEARKPGKGTSLLDSSPALYKEWLKTLCDFTITNFDAEERLIFINAWNEWAEGAYLEPDRRYGYAYLKATSDILATYPKEAKSTSGKWKILFVSHDAAVGGAQAVLLDIMSWFKRHTFIDIKILCFNGGELLSRFREVADTLVISELVRMRVSEQGLIQRFKDFCGDSLDLIYCNSVVSGKLCHIPQMQIASQITHFHELEMSIKRYAGDSIGDILRQSSHFIACSGAVRENLLKTYGVDGSKISTVYSSIRPDNSIKVISDVEKRKIKKSFGLDENTILVFGCGIGMAFRKGADLFIEAARILKARGGDHFHFFWVGGFENKESLAEGKIWADYATVLKKDGLDRHITFLGEQPNPRKLFITGDIFLLPSREDPFPLVALEAAECGLPIICFSDAGGMPDFVEEDAGFVVPYEDVEAMAEKVAVLMQNKELRGKMGIRGREKVLSRFTPEQTVPHILSVCRKVAKKKPAVSVIVPNYNHARYLPKRLDSIFNQTFKDFEVIIIDDASSDNSIEVIEKYCDRADVRIVQNEKNSGSPFPQWLKGIDLARAEIIWIAESDDACETQFLERLLTAFRDTKVKLAYANSYVIDENDRITGDYVNSEYLTSVSQTKWTKSYEASATEEINEGLGVKNTILNISAVLFRKFDLSDAFRKTLDGMHIAGDWYFIAHAIKDGKVHFDGCKLNYHRRHPDSVIGKMVSEKKIEDFFREFYIVQKYIFSDYELTNDFYEKWEGYLRKQWGDFCPNRSFDELKAYYPLDEMKAKILTNAIASEKSNDLKRTPSVSIIIPLFNNVELTKICLTSLANNTLRDKYELVIVDNASTDGTKEFLETLGNDVKLIRNDKNNGFAKACNQGAKEASAPYLLFLNNDTEPLKGWLEKLIAIIDKDSTVAAVGSKLLFPDGTIQHAGVIVMDDKLLPDPLVARHIYYQQPADLPEANRSLTFQALTAACLLVRKSAFEEVGGFDEAYWNGYEDVDLCFKLQEKGWKLVYQPESVVIHHESKSGAERFAKVSKNIDRLHEKWLNKIKPDLIIEKDGSVKQTDAGIILPYFLPKISESVDSTAPVESIEKLTSIIILTHNQLDHTKLCLESIRRHTPEPYELIIADNGSTDGTVDYLKSLMSSRANIRVISNSDNRGFAAGNNQGSGIARGEYILLLNNDTVVTEGWLTRMLNVFKDHPQTGIVGPMSNYVSGPQLVPEIKYKNLDEMNTFAEQWSKEHDGQSMPIYRVVGFCLLAKKEVIDKIGGLDERFGSGNFEDDDFCIRAGLTGYEARVAQDVFIHHTGSQTFKGAGINYNESLLRNWELFKSKWGIPMDTPYGTPYRFPSQLPHGLNLHVPLPDVSLDHNADANKRWWADSSEKSLQKERIPGLTSIIIPTSDDPDYTKKCVQSIRNHTPEPHEIVVIDNGYSLKTTKWLRKQKDPESSIRIIDASNNKGYAEAYNKGVRESSGEYLVLMRDDIVVAEKWLTDMLAHLGSSPDIGIVGPMTDTADGPQKVKHILQNITPDHLSPFAVEFHKRHEFRRINQRALSGFCIVFRYQLFEAAGLFDERFDLGDFAVKDYCIRAALDGKRNLIAGDVFIHSNGHENYPGTKKDYRSAIYRNRNLFNNKWHVIEENSELWKKLLSANALIMSDDLFQKGNTRDAISILEEAIKHSPGDSRSYYALTDILVDAKKYQEALDLLAAMPEGLKQDRGRLERIGYCKEGMELYDEAIRYADEALASDNTSAKAWDLKGTVAFKRGIHAEAEEFFRKAIESDRGFGEAYANLGALQWNAGKHEEAFDSFEKAFILAPTAENIVVNYYTAVVSLSRLDRAEGVFKEAIALYPFNKRLRFIFGDLLLQESKYAEAMEGMEEALVTFGADPDTLAVALELRNKVGAGLKPAPTSNPASISLCMIVKNEEKNIGTCLKSIKPVVDEMIVVDTGSTDRTKDIAKAFGAKVYDLAWTNNFSDARNFSLSKATGKWILVLDADEVVSSDDFDALRKLVKKSAKRPVAYSITSRNYVIPVSIGWVGNDGTYFKEEAGTGWFPSDKVRLFPNDPRVQFENPVHELVEDSLLRAGIDVRKCNIPVHHYGKLNKAKILDKGDEYYQLGKLKLDETGKQDIKALFELARQTSELGKHQEALEIWGGIIKEKPDSVEGHLGMGNSCFNLGRFEEAGQYFQKAFELDPSSKEVIFMYAQCEICAGNFDRAISFLEELHKHNPGYPMAMLALTAIYFAIDKKEKGMEYLQKLREINFPCSEYLTSFSKMLISVKRLKNAILLLLAAVETNNITGETRALLEESYRALQGSVSQ